MTRDLREEIARAVQAREDFLQLLAQSMHDMSQPLTAMLGTLDLALMQPGSVEKYKSSMEQSLEYGEQLARMMRMLREFADGQKTAQSLERVLLGPLVKEIAEDFRPLAEDRGIAFAVASDEPLAVLADPLRLRQTIASLLDIAIMNSAPPASLRLSLAREDTAAVLLLRTVPPDEPAVSAEAPPPVEPPAAPQPRREHRLRIAMSRLVVQGYGGTFDDQSSAEQGIAFRICLPSANE
ncbi:MAG: HAMP domain-containing histidine kinase [Acidobacteria bacterium]|nr:HAMP domain-containing histidine kinase [Acidobacteriota bacterium]MBI3663021.1 HAMP domain-containing histidine kinase [Acidobacteriota bacterium]